MVDREVKEYIDEVIESDKLRDRFFSWNFFVKYGKYLTEEQISRILDRDDVIYTYLYLFAGENFTPELIDKALDKGRDFIYLYDKAGENFDENNIRKAIRIGKNLAVLFEYVGYRFTPELVEEAMNAIEKSDMLRALKSEILKSLYKGAKDVFIPELVDKAIDIGVGLQYLFKNVNEIITYENIHKALDKILSNYNLYDEDLSSLFMYVGYKLDFEHVVRVMVDSNISEVDKDSLLEILREVNPDLYGVVMKYEGRLVEYYYPEVKYFEEKTYKVDRFIDVLKIIYKDMIES
mgnify:CR=1 FL=1